MERRNYQPIKTFQDLEVYRNLYKAMVSVHTEIVPVLPKEEQFDLAGQMRRASKAGPALIAEGFAKRYQKRQWQKYLNDAIGEANEMIHHLSVALDIYRRYINLDACQRIINLYSQTCRQLTKLGQVWKDFHSQK